MNLNNQYEFLDRIPATEANAISMQALTLQDVRAGGFENPTDLANPNNPIKVESQLQKLSQLPDLYNGYEREDQLVAYMKSNEWFTGDEAPFVESSLARHAMKLAGKLRSGSLYPKAFGVFGLVAERTLESDDRDEILHDLLEQSITQGLARAAGVVNIVIHDHDPALPIARDLHFKPVGPKAEAAGAPGLMQQRYQRDL